MKNIDRNYLNKGIDNFGKSMILVVGDIMLDRFIWGNVSRISPEAPVPVVEVERETIMLGGAANVVNNLVSLGGNVMMCGIVGDDSTGEQIISKLNELDVDTTGIAIEHDRPTSVKTRIIAHAQQVVRYDWEKKIPLKPKTTKDILNFIQEKKGNLSALIVSDYGKGVISRQLMDGLRSATSDCNFPVTVDPNVKNFPLYKDVTVITPNHNQAGEIAGLEIVNEEDLKKVGKKLLNSKKCEALLITRGKDGMTLFEEEGRVTHIKSIARKVYDVTGAGDTVIATLTLGIAGGLDMKSAAYLSNLAAGIVVGEIGTSTVKIDNLKELIASHL
ncbi:MAG: D-glycero-beta-D-manno-heptose-7-phosphate kinase [Deltaproteobacteria bacterium]|nr:MAG: D-glycero-beta-D-manno-heptose-7-phosphate kinase [Deltaproteobacteria bacterium]